MRGTEIPPSFLHYIYTVCVYIIFIVYYVYNVNEYYEFSFFIVNVKPQHWTRVRN